MAIINNNVENVKFLRNGIVFTPSADPAKTAREVALDAMEGQKDNLADGTAILGRYQETSGTVKTLVGFAYISGETKTLTIFDVDGASADVEALRQEINAKLGNGVGSGASETVTAQLTALSGTAGASSAETSVEGAKAYAKDYTDEQISGLDYSGITTSDAAVVTNVTEADGTVAATSANVGNLKLTDYVKGSDSGAVVSTDSINDAFSKVENQIDAVNGVIDALDYTDTAVTKQFVAAVDETDGVISITRGEIESSGKTIVLTADGNDVNFEVNIDNDTLQKNADGVISVASAALTQYVGDEDTIHISAVDSSTNTKTISSLLTISATTPSEANVKEQYNLVGASGNTIGATIKIYKDSALLSVALLHADTTANPQVLPTYDKATDTWTDIASPTDENQALCYAYEDVSGNTIVAAVPVGSFINEQEFASGITWDSTANKVRGVVDSTSEVDSNNDPFLTVGANGFKIDGIKDEIAAQLGDVVADLDATVTGATSGSHVTISIEELDGKLVQSGLTIEENDIASASDLAELSGKTISEIESPNSSITVSVADAIDGTQTIGLSTDASKIKMSGFTSTDALSGISSSSSITEAFEEVDAVITENERVIAAALTDLDDRVDTISGDVATISGNVNTISGDVDTLKTNYISGVSVNGSATTVTDHVAGFNITPATSATTASTSNAIVVDTDANGNITLGLNYIDCGTY